MAGFIERANERHYGIVVLQDTATPYPLGDFVEECNASMDLLDSNSEFYTIMSKGMQSSEELNGLAILSKTYVQQCKQWAVQIKNSGKPIYFLDQEFFKQELEKIKQLPPNGQAQRKSCRALYEAFSRTVNNCVSWNRQTARDLHLPPVQEIKQK